MGEAERNSFIALPGKGGPQQDNALKTVCPSPGKGGVLRSLIVIVQGAGLLIRIRVRAGPAFLPSRDHLETIRTGLVMGF